jgi:hypothetical protein
MADNDDINRSGNQNVPNRPFDFGMSRMSDIGRSAGIISAEQEGLRAAAREGRRNLAAYSKLTPQDRMGEFGQWLHRTAVNGLRKEPRIRIGVESSEQRHNLQAVNAISSEFSDVGIARKMREISDLPNVQMAATGMMGTSYEENIGRRSELINQIKSIGAINTQAAGFFTRRGRVDPNVQAGMERRTGLANQLTMELGTINAAVTQQERLGLDPESRIASVRRQAARANEGIVMPGQVGTELASGQGLGARSLKQLKEDEAAAADKLIQTLKNLDNAAGDAKTGFLKTAEETGAKLKEIQEAKRQIGSGGRGFGNWGQGLGAVLGLAGKASQEIFLGQTNTITGNSITAASLTNNLFDRRRAALAGDMTQLTMLTSGVFQGAQAEGAVNKRTSAITDSLMGAGGLIGGGATIAAAGALASSTGIGAALGVPMMMIGGATMAIGGAIKGINVMRGADSNAEKLAEEQRQIALAAEMAHVPGAYRQRLYDFSMGARGAALEAGGWAGADFLNQTVGTGSANNLGRMQRARIGTEQFSAFAAQGFGQQGNVFDTEQIYAARAMERASFGSMGRNMERMGTLAQAGSNNPLTGLQSVLEAAFTKSLDGSKVLDMMVQNTAAMAAASVGNTMMGLDTTGSSARILANLVNPDLKNEPMAVNRAATAAGILNDVNTNMGTGFAEMAGTTAVARATGKDWLTAVNLRGLKNQDRDALKTEALRIQKMTGADRAGAEAKLADQLVSAGLIDFTKGSTVNTKGLLTGLEAANQQIYRKLIPGINPSLPGFSELSTGQMSLEQAKTKFPDLFAAVTKAAPAMLGLTGREAATRGEGLGVTASGAAKAESLLSGKGEAQKVLDDLATRQFTEMTKEAKAAAEQLGGVSAALEKIDKASAALAGKLGDKTSDKVMASSAEAAKSFEMGAETFTTGVTNFGTILNNFARNIGVRVPAAEANKSGKR